MNSGFSVGNPGELQRELDKQLVASEEGLALIHRDEEEAESSEREVKEMSAVELLTIVKSKGLTADHVIIIGFDDVNMKFVSKNAFYVALTRARKSLHLLTSMSQV